MLKNFVISALRNLRREGVVSGISIIGLASGLAVALLIILYVLKEFSYDRFEQSDRIYRLELKQISDQSPKWAISHHSTVKDIALRSPDIEDVMFFKRLFQVARVRVGDQEFFEENVAVSNSTFVSFTDINVVKGNKDEMLKNPREVILSEDYALKYFKEEEPIGKLIEVDTATFLVSGVFTSTTPSHLASDIIISERKDADLRWIFTYLKLRQGADPVKVLNEINSNAPELSGVFYNDTEYNLVNIQDIHFKSTAKYQLSAGGNIDTVYILLVIGILILAIASINFINLTSAIFIKATKESAIRTILGSSKGQLFQRFFIQSGLLLLISTMLGVLLFIMIMPIANESLNLELQFHELDLTWIGAAGIGLIGVFFITNILPSLKPAQGNKSEVLVKKRTGMHALLVFQFSIAVVLIVGTFLVRDQLGYMIEKYLGYGDDAVLFVTFDDQSLWTKTTEFRKRFESHPAVLFTSSIMGAPGDAAMMGNQNAWAEGMTQGENIFLPLYAGEEEFVETLGLNVIQGSGFNEGVNASDSISGLLINETAVKQFGWDDAIGKRMMISGSPCRVVGVVEDFHFLDLHQPIGPLAVMFQPNNYNIAVRINSEGLTSAMEFIEEEYKKMDPAHPFNAFFLEENFQKQYESEARLIQVLNVLSVLAISICAIGILGMVLMIMDERTKEIGIRKVLGASLYQIVFLLNKKVLTLLAIANLVAWPLAYFLGDNWLQSFAYRTNIDLTIFLIASVIVLVIVLVTISFHSVKSALRNPVETLRYE